ncbi:MAG: MFS transporter [Prevotella sp.]|nr:MFS transporter [Prevotella sp.]
MNTQNTPVHIKLWNRDFWLMAIANMLLSVSVYVLVPTLPLWTIGSLGFGLMETGVAMGLFGVGLYALGGFCSYLVQRFRRNVVCMWAIVGLAVSLVALLYLDGHRAGHFTLYLIILGRFLAGATYGLAQMVLSSTLIIDTSESFQRTEANHSAAWFSRFAVALGPLAGLLLMQLFDFQTVAAVSVASALVAVLLIKFIDFPFRAPEDQLRVFSLDRFFLPNGCWLFFNLVLVTFVVGLIFTLPLPFTFYGIMMSGFLLAVLAQRFVFLNAELKSEVISGLVLLGGAILLMLTRRQEAAMSYLPPLMIGFGVGIIGARFLLFFIKLSRHCQRGTSQSMYMLSWETGLAAGLFAGYALLFGQPRRLLSVALLVVVVSFFVYNFFVHDWFVRHRNR